MLPQMNADATNVRDVRIQRAIIACALLALVLLHATHGLPFNWDDQGQYLSHSRALLAGRPYTDIGFIYTTYNNFIGPVAEPPGVPVLILPALAISGADLLPVRVVMLFTLLLFLWLVWKVIEPFAGRWTATAVIVMAIAVFSWQHVLDGVMSDLPFCAAIWCVLYAADTDSPLSRGRLITMAIAGAAAFTFRMAALALLPSIALLMLLRPRRQWLGLVLVAVVWAAAGALVMFALPTSTALVAETSLDWSKVLFDVRENLHVISFGVLETFLYPFTSNRANDVLHVVELLLAIVGSWALLRAGPRRFAYLFALSYVLMLLVLPTRATRYWWPLVPLQALAMVEGLAVLIRRVPSVPRWVPAAVVALLFAIGLPHDARERATPFFERDEVTQVVAALRSASPDVEPRVAIFSPRQLTWHTRIPAMGHFKATPEQTLAELRDKGITFLVSGSLEEWPEFSASIDRAIAARPDAYQLMGTFGGLTLLRVLP